VSATASRRTHSKCHLHVINLVQLRRTAILDKHKPFPPPSIVNVRVFDLLFVNFFCFIETKIIAQLRRSYVVKSLNSACVA